MVKSVVDATRKEGTCEADPNNDGGQVKAIAAAAECEWFYEKELII